MSHVPFYRGYTRERFIGLSFYRAINHVACTMSRLLLRHVSHIYTHMNDVCDTCMNDKLIHMCVTHTQNDMCDTCMNHKRDMVHTCVTHVIHMCVCDTHVNETHVIHMCVCHTSHSHV